MQTLLLDSFDYYFRMKAISFKFDFFEIFFSISVNTLKHNNKKPVAFFHEMNAMQNNQKLPGIGNWIQWIDFLFDLHFSKLQ